MEANVVRVIGGCQAVLFILWPDITTKVPSPAGVRPLTLCFVVLVLFAALVPDTSSKGVVCSVATWALQLYFRP